MQRLDRFIPESPNTGPSFDNNTAESLADIMQEKISAAIRLADRHTSRSAKDTVVKDLDGNTAGLYTFATKERAIDTTFVATMSAAEIAHVLVHEDGHAQNHANSNTRIISADVEEGINELRTSQRLNREAMAYHTEISTVKTLARQTGHNITTVLAWYGQGNNEAINQMIQAGEAKAA